MRTVLKSHSEVCHIWAQQSQQEGRAGNMFFEGKSIYSYGHHFEIARFVDDNTVLYTNRGYSPSTGCHKAHVRSSIIHKTVFEVPNLTTDSESHKENVEYFIEQIEVAKKKSIRAIKCSDYWLDIAKTDINYVESYISMFNPKLPRKTRVIVNNLIKTKENILSPEIIANIKEKERIRKQKELAKNKENILKWKNGELIRLPYGMSKVFLRIKEETVQTSLGAEVSIKEGKVLYNMIKADKPVHGFSIGYYTVQSYINDVLTVGCHKIERNEINRIANMLDW